MYLKKKEQNVAIQQIMSDSSKDIDLFDFQDVNLEEAYKLIEKLDIFSCNIYFKIANINLTFGRSQDGALWVEIDDFNDDFWAYTDITLEAAKKVLLMVLSGEHFGDFIPVTNEVWDAFSRG